LFSTITKFCSPDTWDRPNQAKSENVSTQHWGLKGAWTIKITPSLVAAVHLGGAGKMKVSTAAGTSTASGGTTSNGSEIGGEAGPASAKASQGTGTSHGGGYTGGGGAEGEYESQRFNVTVQFNVEIHGGWTEGTAASALRVGTAITTLGLSEAARAAGDAIAPGQRTWAASHKAGYMITVPTEVCTKIG
jgi:hypothetical protein